VQATRSRLRSVTAVAVAALLVVANLIAYWHQATVVHARCAEHGELVHTAPPAGAHPGDHGPATVGAADVESGHDHVVAIASRSWTADDEHDHCQLCPLTRESPRLGAPPAISAPPLTAAPRSVAAITAAPDVSRDLVRFAPKTSPPV
jgi:hypothetical protein